MLTNLNLPDMETCYKMFRREIIQSINIEEDRFGVEPEIIAKIAKKRWRISEVGIHIMVALMRRAKRSVGRME
jgi:hypothetical protein